MSKPGLTTKPAQPTPVTKESLVASLAAFVSEDDIEMSRMDFLRTVASRILDDIDP